MFKVEDILARLQNGENASDIADEMVDVLNKANHQFQKEEEEKAKRAEEEAKAKKAEHEAHLKETQKLADLQEILDLIHDFCLEYYCETVEDIDTVEEAFKELDAKSVNEIIKNLGIYAVKMAELEKHFNNMFGSMLFGMPVAKKLPKKSAPAPETRNADVVIDNFLSSLGLK